MESKPKLNTSRRVSLHATELPGCPKFYPFSQYPHSPQNSDPGASTYVEASPTLSCLFLGPELNLHYCPRFIVYVQTDKENGQRGHRIFSCCLLETTTFNSLIRTLPRNVEPQPRKGLSVARVRPTSNRCGSPAQLAARRDRPHPA